jgi:hypothetical protein
MLNSLRSFIGKMQKSRRLKRTTDQVYRMLKILHEYRHSPVGPWKEDLARCTFCMKCGPVEIETFGRYNFDVRLNGVRAMKITNIGSYDIKPLNREVDRNIDVYIEMISYALERLVEETNDPECKSDRQLAEEKLLQLRDSMLKWPAEA